MAEEAKPEHGQRREAAKEKAAGVKDKAAAKAAEMREKAQEQGFFGDRPEGPSHEDYSLQTGADSPSAFDANVAAKEAELAAMQASRGDNDEGEA